MIDLWFRKHRMIEPTKLTACCLKTPFNPGKQISGSLGGPACFERTLNHHFMNLNAFPLIGTCWLAIIDNLAIRRWIQLICTHVKVIIRSEIFDQGNFPIFVAGKVPCAEQLTLTLRIVLTFKTNAYGRTGIMSRSRHGNPIIPRHLYSEAVVV